MVVVAAVSADLFIKAVCNTPDWAMHPRPDMVSLQAGVWMLSPLILCFSTWLRLPVCLLVAGAAGNWISALPDGRVENPFVFVNGEGVQHAFNLADVLILTGVYSSLALLPFAGWRMLTTMRRVLA